MEIPISFNAPDSRLIVLNLPASADGQPVVLAIRPQDSSVVALTAEVAEEAWAAGALRGWEPGR